MRRRTRTSPKHAAVAAALRAERDSLVTSQIVVAEADYLILRSVRSRRFRESRSRSSRQTGSAVVVLTHLRSDK